MTTSILRTADEWWVQTASSAARIDTDATTTRELLADRSAIEAAASSCVSRSLPSCPAIAARVPRA